MTTPSDRTQETTLEGVEGVDRALNFQGTHHTERWKGLAGPGAGEVIALPRTGQVNDCQGLTFRVDGLSG